MHPGVDAPCLPARDPRMDRVDHEATALRTRTPVGVVSIAGEGGVGSGPGSTRLPSSSTESTSTTRSAPSARTRRTVDSLRRTTSASSSCAARSVRTAPAALDAAGEIGVEVDDRADLLPSGVQLDLQRLPQRVARLGERRPAGADGDAVAPRALAARLLQRPDDLGVELAGDRRGAGRRFVDGGRGGGLRGGGLGGAGLEGGQPLLGLQPRRRGGVGLVAGLVALGFGRGGAFGGRRRLSLALGPFRLGGARPLVGRGARPFGGVAGLGGGGQLGGLLGRALLGGRRQGALGAESAPADDGQDEEDRGDDGEDDDDDAHRGSTLRGPGVSGWDAWHETPG